MAAMKRRSPKSYSKLMSCWKANSSYTSLVQQAHMKAPLQPFVSRPCALPYRLVTARPMKFLKLEFPGYCFICAAFLFFCLFLQFYFAVIFNCWPLLICHAFQAGGMCLSIFVLLMCSLLLSYPTQITVVQYRITAVLVVATGIIILIVVATFATSSFSRARELWAFEVTHTDHLRRLLIDALDTLEEYKQERTSTSGD